MQSKNLYLPLQQQIKKDMKTFKTNLGIEFDIDILSYGRRSIEVMAIRPEGSKSFYIHLKIDTELRRMLESGDDSWIKEEMLTEAMHWVNETVIGHLASEVAKLCLRKSTKDVYWTYSFGTLNIPNLTITSIDTYAGNVGALRDSYQAYGENEIRELLNELNR